MEMADEERAGRVATLPEAEFESSFVKMSLSNKSHDIVNRNGIIDKHVERTLDKVLSNNDEQLSNCSSYAKHIDEEDKPFSCQPEYVEKTIFNRSNRFGSDVCKSALVDDIRLKSTKPTSYDNDSSQTSKDMPLEQIESSADEISNNTESNSGRASKLVVKNNGQDHEIVFVQYKSEDQLPDLVALITVDLSEPYSVYTYRYFLHNWPHLSHLAYHDNECVGAIVCKLDIHRKNVLRGYIAMLVVHKSYRRWKIGSSLVRKAVKKMIDHGCEEVVLETEVTNKAALRLYENLGFVRDKRLLRYYLNGVDAWRLKLWLK